MARMAETPYQNPQEFMYCGRLTDRDYYIAKIHWLRCVRRGAMRSYKEEREVKYLSINAVIRTDGPVVLTKPPRGIRKGEFDLSSDEQTRIFNAAQLGSFLPSFLFLLFSKNSGNSTNAARCWYEPNAKI